MIRRSPFFRVVRFTKSLPSAKNILHYAAFRSVDAKDKGPAIFDARSDQADVKEFHQRLDDPITRHPNAAKAYHCLFSLSRGAFDRLAPGSDWHDIVRSVMRTYELETQRRLTWIGVVHDNPTHPHVHVVIKAAYQNQAGTSRRLRLDKKEITRFREITGRELEARGLTMDRSKDARPFQRDPVGERRWAIGGTLSWLQERIREEQHRRDVEQHEARQRQRAERTGDEHDR